jgi:hypothetical protein
MSKYTKSKANKQKKVASPMPKSKMKKHSLKHVSGGISTTGIAAVVNQDLSK